MATVVSFDKMHFNGWPDDALVKTRLPIIGIWAPPSSQASVDHVELVTHKLLAISDVGFAWRVHPGDKVAARCAAALRAEDRIAVFMTF